MKIIFRYKCKLQMFTNQVTIVPAFGCNSVNNYKVY